MTNTNNNNDDELNQLNNLDDPNFLKQEYRNTITSEETPEDSQSEFHELVEYIDEEIEETDEDESSAIFNEEVIEDIVSVNKCKHFFRQEYNYQYRQNISNSLQLR